MKFSPEVHIARALKLLEQIFKLHDKVKTHLYKSKINQPVVVEAKKSKAKPKKKKSPL
jgi:hypothetical protein